MTITWQKIVARERWDDIEILTMRPNLVLGCDIMYWLDTWPELLARGGTTKEKMGMLSFVPNVSFEKWFKQTIWMS